ncbi:MAG: hypothetical protein KGJ02_06080 [Verrucomicrobiota bacterium]|nr:hypothetical protein [Verrucomicrobiota bacterium]
MNWEEFRTPPKFGCELPSPKGPGFRRPDEEMVFISSAGGQFFGISHFFSSVDKRISSEQARL